MTHSSRYLMKVGVVGAALMAGVNTWVSAAVADDIGVASRRADQLALEGETAAKAGDLAAARNKLAQAFALKSAYDIAGNLGGIEFGLGQYREAAEHLSFSLRTYAATGDARERNRTVTFLNEALTHVCSLTFGKQPAGAIIDIDGERMQTTPPRHAHFADPGEHTVTVSAPGYELTQRQLSCAAGSEMRVPVRLQRAAAKGVHAAGGTKWPVWPALVGSAVVATTVFAGLATIVQSQRLNLAATTTQYELARGGDPTTVCYHKTTSQCAKLKTLRTDEALFYNFGVASLVTGGAAALLTTLYLAGCEISGDAHDEKESIVAQVQFAPGRVMLTGTF